MPNQDFCERREDINLANCDLSNSFKSCQPSEKLCRFAYASWCPACDLDSHRRRSKSECIEPQCRKRVRDMRSQSPKTKSPEIGDYVNFRHKLESSRVLTNLCELPTTYISNCQTNVPSNDSMISKKNSNFIEPLRTDRTRFSDSPPRTITNSVLNGDNLKSNGFFKPHYTTSPRKINPHVKHNGVTTINESFPSHFINHNRLDDTENIKEKIIKAVKSQQQYDDNITKNCKRDSFLKSNEINHVCKDPTLALNENVCCIRRHLPTPKSPKKIEQNCEKQSANSEKMPSSTAEMKEKVYAKYDFPIHTIFSPDKEEANHSSESKRKIRQRNDSNNIPIDKQAESCTVISKKAREISPLENKREFRAKSAVKVASIKNRHKLSVVKLRKVRNKIAHSVSSDSNHSGSDCSETEDEEKSESSDVFDHLFANSSTDNINGSTPINCSYDPVSVSWIDDKEKWPVRPSLFPFIPPYISFSSHDSEQFSLPENVSRFLKWKLSTITPVIVRKTLTNTGFRLIRSEYSRESNDWSGTWGKHIKSVCFQTLKETQKLNHFPGTFQIGRKDRLWKNLQRMMLKFGHKEFGFIPRTYVLPTDLKLLRQSWEATGHDRWIIKPPASARGTGIKVIHRWAHLPKKKSLVVQQYISNPYLINGSKFDLRLYVLVTSFNPLRIYLYPEGLARFASTKYSDDLSTLSDRYMHLTNYSINKLSSQYTANEDANACKGHKWTLSKLWEYLEKDGVNTKTLWRNLQQLVIKTMICGESSITQLCRANMNSRYNCYELFGVDVLLDERLKPWLLEVNISPSLHSASPLDLHVKGPLVQSLLNLAQFHLPPKIARIRNAPPCFNNDLYVTRLSTKERLKQVYFCEFEKREEYLTDILCDLTGDDIRHLAQAEDELTVTGNFERIFPTRHSHSYFQYMETRYYNRLFDAWEHHYEKDRKTGIILLQTLCEKKLHLVVSPPPANKPPLLREVSQESSVEESTSDESVQQTLPKTAHSSPAPANTDPNAKLIRNDVQYKMMNLKLGTKNSLMPSSMRQINDGRFRPEQPAFTAHVCP